MKPSHENPGSWIWLEGQVMATSDASIGVLDRAFLYGDSIFETLLIRNQHPVFLADHVERLRDGADRLEMSVEQDDDSLRQIIDELITYHPAEDDMVVRITLTRGDRIDHDIGTASCRPRLLVMTTTLDTGAKSSASGFEVVVSQRRKIPPACLDPGIKSGNYLGSILARSEANSSGADEAILLSVDGVVTEATTANLFWIVDNTVYSCSDDLVLPGITRSKILNILDEDQIPFETGHFPLEHLLDAEEAFLTGSICGVIPIDTLQNSSLSSSRPDSLTCRLHARYEQLIDVEISGRIR